MKTTFQKIKNIKKSEPKNIYHLSVKNNSNYFGNGLCLHNCYRGNLGVKLYNFSQDHYQVKKGDRIAQIVFYPVVEPTIEWTDEKTETIRNEKGFGSSGL